MSRPHGRADVSQTQPRAWAVCDRCGGLYNHVSLRWQMDWRGPKLQNLRFLVCPTCYDAYQQNGQRTIILPADPIPIMNARPEQYVVDSNPLSGLNASPNPARWQDSGQIGTLTRGAGVAAAFNGVANKPAAWSARIVTPNSSFENYVGINWSGFQGIVATSSLSSPVLTHTLSSYTVTAPRDTTFGSSAYVIQGSDMVAGWASWTTLASGNTAGTVGEVIAGNTTAGPRFQFHRVAFYGVGSPISVAQVTFSVSDGSSNT